MAWAMNDMPISDCFLTSMGDEKSDGSLKNASLYSFDTEIIRSKISETKSDSPTAISTTKRIAKNLISEPFDFRHLDHCGFENFNPSKENPTKANGVELNDLGLSDILRSSLTDNYSKSNPNFTRQLSKDQISEPRQFRHLIHIGTIKNSSTAPPESMQKVRVEGIDVYFNDESYANLATKIHTPVFVGEERYIDERKPRPSPEQDPHKHLAPTGAHCEKHDSSNIRPRIKEYAKMEIFEKNDCSNPMPANAEKPVPKPRKSRPAPLHPQNEPQTEIKIEIAPPKPPREILNTIPVVKPSPIPKPRTRPAPPPPQLNTNSTTIDATSNSSGSINKILAQPRNIYDAQRNPANLELKLSSPNVANRTENHSPKLVDASHIISQHIPSESPTTPTRDQTEIILRKSDSEVFGALRTTKFDAKPIKESKPPLPPKAKKPPLRPVIFDELEHDPDEPDEDASELSIEPPELSHLHYRDLPPVRSLTKRPAHLPPDLPKRLENEAKYLQNFQVHESSSSWSQRENNNKKNDVNRYENVKQVWEEIELEKPDGRSISTKLPTDEIVYRPKQPSSLTAAGRIRRTKSLVLDDTESIHLERAKMPVKL